MMMNCIAPKLSVEIVHGRSGPVVSLHRTDSWKLVTIFTIQLYIDY